MLRACDAIEAGPVGPDDLGSGNELGDDIDVILGRPDAKPASSSNELAELARRRDLYMLLEDPDNRPLIFED